MSEANIEVKVSIDTVIQEALAAFARQMLKQNGIRLDTVRFKWESPRRMGERSFLAGVDVESGVQFDV